MFTQLWNRGCNHYLPSSHTHCMQDENLFTRNYLQISVTDSQTHRRTDRHFVTQRLPHHNYYDGGLIRPNLFTKIVDAKLGSDGHRLRQTRRNTRGYPLLLLWNNRIEQKLGLAQSIYEEFVCKNRYLVLKKIRPQKVKLRNNSFAVRIYEQKSYLLGVER